MIPVQATAKSQNIWLRCITLRLWMVDGDLAFHVAVGTRKFTSLLAAFLIWKIQFTWERARYPRATVFAPVQWESSASTYFADDSKIPLRISV